MKADLERELEDFSLNCSKCCLDLPWVSGLGVSPRHWAPGACAARRAGGLSVARWAMCHDAVVAEA